MNATLVAALRTKKPSIEQRELIMSALGYEPWPEQADFHFDIDPETGEERRHKLVTGGEQAGKSFSAAMEMMTKLFWGKIFWIVAPDYSQAKNEFNYLEQWLTRLGILASVPSKPEKGAWKMKTVLGQTITTKSTQDVATIAGEAPDGILFVEAGQAPYEAFLRCYGRTAPKRGWLCVNGTFEKDTGAWLRQLWKAAQNDNKWRMRSFSIPTWSNRSFYPGGLEDPEIVAQQEAFRSQFGNDDHFNERFGGIPAQPAGLVHPEFDFTMHVKTVRREGLLKDWEADPERYQMFPDDGTVVLPIDTVDELWIDPGFNHAYAVEFVTVWQDHAIVYDELYYSGRHTEQMAELAMQHPRFKQVGRLIIDHSGQGMQGGNKAAALVWKEKTGMMPLSRPVKDVRDGIERCRVSLSPDEAGIPQIILDPKCGKTAWEFSEGYKYPRDRWGNLVPTDKPEDINNDAVKAIVYGLTLNFGPAKRSQRNRAQMRRDRDKSGTGRTVGGWETLYENTTGVGLHDPHDPAAWQLTGDDDDGYDSSYEGYFDDE